MLCNIKPVPFHESDKHIFAKIPRGGRGFRTPGPPSGSAHVGLFNNLDSSGYARELLQFKTILFQAYKVGLYGPKILWFFPGWFTDFWWRLQLEKVPCTV